ncbi:MAG: (2Fe-2S)-binding protein [Anaerolineales bacterium]|nr:(2Fe-2S)-binding protein [Anaerolineales bacterium]
MELLVNGQTVEAGPLENRLLIYVLRDQLGLTGTRLGCGGGFCGSCTVWLDGVPTRSCQTPAAEAAGQALTTIEGLADTYPAADLHPVQQAFLEVQVPQCGWCMSGQIMTAAAFVNANPNPSDEDLLAALEKNLCRCGTYHRIKQAVRRAAELARAQAA